MAFIGLGVVNGAAQATSPAYARDQPRSVAAARASSAGTLVVRARDKRGDVRVRKAKGAPSRSERKGIDIKKVEAFDRGRTVRFSVKIREYVRTKKFHQMVFIDLSPVDHDVTRWTSISMGWSPQVRRRLAYVSAYDESTGTYRNCIPTRMGARAKTDVLWADIPKTCLAAGRVQMQVGTVTGLFRTDAPSYSSDRLRVPGLPTIVQPAQQ